MKEEMMSEGMEGGNGPGPDQMKREILIGINTKRGLEIDLEKETNI